MSIDQDSVLFEAEDSARSPAFAMPNIVSVDDHVQEPPTLWTSRLSQADAPIGPHVVREKIESRVGGELEWCDVWVYEDQRYPILRVSASVGFPPEDVEVLPMTFEEMRPGCFEPIARLADMDQNHTDMSLCFPNLFVRFCGQRFVEAKDAELAGRCVRAYNDWLFDEWCAASDGRLFGAMILPLWDPVACAEEVTRNAGKPGAAAVCFSEIPPWLGLPSIHSGAWEPLFRVCDETETLVCMHIGSSSGRMWTSDDAPSVVTVTNNYAMTSLSLADWLTSELFDRFPRLRILYAESQGGWMPYLLQRLDRMWEQGIAYSGAADLRQAPSTYFAKHVFTSIFDDPVAISQIGVIGEDNICFETDYPHPDTTWPNSLAVAERNFGHLDPAVATKLVRGNALKLLGCANDGGNR